MAKPRLLAETGIAERLPQRALDGTVIGYRSQLVRHLRSQSLGQHADLFAEATLTPDRIRWHTTLEGEPSSYSERDEADQARLRDTVGALLADIRNEAARLRAGSDAQRRLAEVLEAATRGILWSDLWILTEAAASSESRAVEHYVLAGWGLAAPEGRPPVPDLLGVFVPAVMPAAPEPEALPPPPVEPPPEPAWPWPLRLLALSAALLLMAGLLAWQLPALAGVLLAFRLPEPPVCVLPPESGLPNLQDEEARLRARIAELERAYAGRVLQCRIAQAPPPRPAPPAPPTAAPAPTPAPPPAQRSDIERRLEREGVPRSEYSVSLSWDSVADLDLHVDCPGGGTIFHGNPAACGGRLNLDMNAGDARSTTPVENIAWDAPPPSGTYRIRVVYYDVARRRGPVPFRLRIVTAGQVREVSGVASTLEGPPPTEFRVP
ncbi:hypothetical protein ACVFYP_13285 [Roseomonas sp. F4]